jgi:PIN domain nuclease of toxin-antitoxin system
VSLLLDTHALLWWLAGDPMEERALDLIADPGTLVAVSTASIWEVAIKRALGRLGFDGSIAQEARGAGFEPLAISFDHAEHAGALPAHHRDPFDRMLVAQAQDEGLTIVTRDRALAAYEVDLLPC